MAEAGEGGTEMDVQCYVGGLLGHGVHSHRMVGFQDFPHSVWEGYECLLIYAMKQALPQVKTRIVGNRGNPFRRFFLRSISNVGLSNPNGSLSRHAQP